MKKLPEITLLHIIGCTLILLCHYFQNAHIGSLGEIFLSGLSLFFVVSGYLAGIKENYDVKWTQRRFVRILKPYYTVVLLALLIYYLFAPQELNYKSTAYILTCTQGINYLYWKFNDYQAMLGFGHFWYITEMLFCIILTPLFGCIYSRAKLKKTSWYVSLGVLILIVQPIAILCGFQLSYVITYLIGFLFAKEHIKPTRKQLASIYVIFILITMFRFAGMRMIDGSVLYDRYIALVSQASLAVAIFYTVFYIGRVKTILIETLATKRLTIFLSSITYEIYLIHYFFLRGPWPMENIFNSKILGDIAVTVFSVITAYMVNRIINLRINR